MIFKEIQIERFRSFQRPTRFVFPGPGLVYLTGENRVNPELEANGCGKTSLLESVYWVLFGKLSSGLSAGNIANWEVPRGCNGKLKLEGHTVIRTWGPNSLKLDGKEVDQDTLERELVISPELFLHSILFPQEEKSSFLDLRPEEKMQLMTEVLKLHIWDKASEVASEETNAATNDIAGLEGRLGELDGTLSSLDPEPLRKQAEVWEREREEEIQSIRDQIRRIKVPVIIGNKPDLRSLYREEADAKSELRKLTDEFNGFADFNRGICPRCGSKLDRTHIAAEKKSLTKKIASAKKQAEKVSEKVQNAEVHERKIREAEQTQGEIRNYQDRLERLRGESNPYREQYQKIKDSRRLAQLRLAQLRTDLHQIRRHREIAKFWIKGFKEVRLLVVDTVIAQLEAEVNRTIHELGLVGWSISFEVERETKSGHISRGFNTLVQSPGNAAQVPWNSWSGGEKQRLRLAGAFGFANLIHDMTGHGTNLEMYDENSTFMSRTGVDQYLDTLKERAERYNRAIMVVDHHASHYGGFNEVITIIKSQEGSEILGSDQSYQERVLGIPGRKNETPFRLRQSRPTDS